MNPIIGLYTYLSPTNVLLSVCVMCELPLFSSENTVPRHLCVCVHVCAGVINIILRLRLFLAYCFNI